MQRRSEFPRVEIRLTKEEIENVPVLIVVRSRLQVPYKIEPRRTGDIASMYADSRLAEKELGWSATYDLEKMCKDFWRWQAQNPSGYRSTEKNGSCEPNGTA